MQNHDLCCALRIAGGTIRITHMECDPAEDNIFISTSLHAYIWYVHIYTYVFIYRELYICIHIYIDVCVCKYGI